jgi:hypothetical protein
MYAYATNDVSAIMHKVARDIGLVVRTEWEPNRSRVKFTLRLGDDRKRFAKRSPNPVNLVFNASGVSADEWTWRRTGTVCFHGHYAFIAELLRYPAVRKIESGRLGRIVYTAETFPELAAELGSKPLGDPGNIYHRFTVRDTCECAFLHSDENDEETTNRILGVCNVAD